MCFIFNILIININYFIKYIFVIYPQLLIFPQFWWFIVVKFSAIWILLNIQVLRADCINERVGAYYYSFVLYEYSDPLLTHSLEMLINKSNPSITLASQHQRENMQKKIRHNFCFKLPQQVKINLKDNLGKPSKKKLHIFGTVPKRGGRGLPKPKLSKYF